MRRLIYSLLTLDLTLITYTDYKFSVTSWYSKFATFVRERDYEKQSIFSMFSFDINLIKIHPTIFTGMNFEAIWGIN